MYEHLEALGRICTAGFQGTPTFQHCSNHAINTRYRWHHWLGHQGRKRTASAKRSAVSVIKLGTKQEYQKSGHIES